MKKGKDIRNTRMRRGMTYEKIKSVDNNLK